VGVCGAEEVGFGCGEIVQSEMTTAEQGPGCVRVVLS